MERIAPEIYKLNALQQLYPHIPGRPTVKNPRGELRFQDVLTPRCSHSKDMKPKLMAKKENQIFMYI